MLRIESNLLLRDSPNQLERPLPMVLCKFPFRNLPVYPCVYRKLDTRTMQSEGSSSEDYPVEGEGDHG